MEVDAAGYLNEAEDDTENSQVHSDDAAQTQSIELQVTDKNDSKISDKTRQIQENESTLLEPEIIDIYSNMESKAQHTEAKEKYADLTDNLIVDSDNKAEDDTENSQVHSDDAAQTQSLIETDGVSAVFCKTNCYDEYSKTKHQVTDKNDSKISDNTIQIQENECASLEPVIIDIDYNMESKEQHTEAKEIDVDLHVIRSRKVGPDDDVDLPDNLIEDNDTRLNCQQLVSAINDPAVMNLIENGDTLSISSEPDDDSSEDSSSEESTESSESDNNFVMQDEEKRPKTPPAVAIVACVVPEIGNLVRGDKSKLEVEEVDLVLPENANLEVIGEICSIIEKQVVVIKTKPNSNVPALDLDTVIFLADRSPLGKIYETFGPVVAPFYVVCIKDREDSVEVAQTVFYAPQQSAITSLVLPSQLVKGKGSDASWRNDEEPPPSCLEYSDDEEERFVKREKKRKSKPLVDDRGDPPRKNRYHNNSRTYVGGSMAASDIGWMNAINRNRNSVMQNRPPLIGPSVFNPNIPPPRANYNGVPPPPPGMMSPPRFPPIPGWNPQWNRFPVSPQPPFFHHQSQGGVMSDMSQPPAPPPPPPTWNNFQ